jgi:hypothetical protein
LAMSDIVIGESKNDRSKDRCARVFDRLATAESIFRRWSQLRIRRSQSTESEYSSIFRTIDAHRELYESICEH